MMNDGVIDVRYAYRFGASVKAKNKRERLADITYLI
jgi:hypothetical protein